MFRTYLEQVAAGERLSSRAMEGAMEAILKGEVTDIHIAAFLMGLRLRGETIDEITAAARVLRQNALKVEIAQKPLLDVVGTGGDGGGTFNISTAAALVAASAGLPVAKHGNRSVSSRCGSADVVEALGIPLFDNPSHAADSLGRTNFTFLYAPYFHKAMKHVKNARSSLGLRTLFNVLGPLINPAGATRYLMGVYSPELLRPLAEVLRNLGADRALVVHGAGGIDEISLSGSTRFCFLREGVLEEGILEPGDFGLSRHALSSFAGGKAEKNAAILRDIFEGRLRGAPLDMVLCNAAGALVAGGLTEDFREGVALARECIESGGVMRKIEELRSLTPSKDADPLGVAL
jgi:anthranilate phosphoribosyltransferase